MSFLVSCFKCQQFKVKLNKKEIMPILNIIGHLYDEDLRAIIKDNDIKNYPFNYFKAYPHGGIEVKNTFGVKKPKTDLKPRDSRLGKIQKKLVWKAHHQYTNNLLALHSDYISNIPQVIGIYYANNLTISDWTITQKPKEGSTMTSFCQTETSGFIKIKQGLICFKEGIGYEHFI